MPRETPSPIDLPDEPLEAPGLGWAAGAIAVASLVLLATNAISIRDWADDLPPGPAQARLAAAADGWLGMTETIGIALPRAAAHSLWKKIEAARFAGQPPADAQ